MNFIYNLKNKFVYFFVFNLFLSCSGDSERQELINKLRTLGASVNPLVSTPSVVGQPTNTVEVTLYAALPLGATASLETFKDPNTGSTPFTVNLNTQSIKIITGTETYTDHNALRIFSAKAKIDIPMEADFLSQMPVNTPFLGGQIRYGLKVKSGDKFENVISNISIVPQNSKALAWKNPTIGIAAPLSGAQLSTTSSVNLTADNISNSNEDDLKYAWFVSSGEVENRRNTNTFWNKISSGPQTAIFAVHGKISRSFSFAVVDGIGQ